LPPIPPTGISDVRFESNRLVEDLSLNQVIQLNSLEYPVKIKVEGAILRISDEISKGKFFDEVISDGKEITLVDSKIQSISIQNLELPEEFTLSQNYPKPFHPTTKIEYSIPQSARVTLKVFDILGNEVITLIDETKKAGTHSIEFDASRLSSGIYFYKLKVGDRYLIRKMNLVK
ncbi:MAG: T9SS type A sorting domain-containing protein, partial [Ignavibacteria bacterium]|nr:T9SS type A sorting domain-containing protein [Ignavibacteria bacterium]